MEAVVFVFLICVLNYITQKDVLYKLFDSTSNYEQPNKYFK